MSSLTPLFRDLRLDGIRFRQLNLAHPEVEARILEEISEGIPVYYDRDWPLTRRFCRILLQRSYLVAHRHVLVVGAGVGLESVVVGRVARRLWVNDIAPVALELQLLQLQENGIAGARAMSGSFGEIVLPDEVDLVMGCFVVYDPGTGKAMEALLDQARRRGIATLLADMDIGGHFSRLLRKQDGPVRRIPVPDRTNEGSDGTNEPIQVVVVG